MILKAGNCTNCDVKVASPSHFLRHILMSQIFPEVPEYKYTIYSCFVNIIFEDRAIFSNCQSLWLRRDGRRYRKEIGAPPAAARWRLRFVVRVDQLLRANFSDCQSLWPRRDGRRYRKEISAELEAARWRLRFVVGVSQLLRAIFSDCQTLRPSWTVAATGKICTELAALRWRLRFVVGVSHLLRANFLRLPESPG